MSGNKNILLLIALLAAGAAAQNQQMLIYANEKCSGSPDAVFFERDASLCASMKCTKGDDLGDAGVSRSARNDVSARTFDSFEKFAKDIKDDESEGSMELKCTSKDFNFSGLGASYYITADYESEDCTGEEYALFAFKISSCSPEGNGLFTTMACNATGFNFFECTDAECENCVEVANYYEPFSCDDGTRYYCAAGSQTVVAAAVTALVAGAAAFVALF